MLSKENTEILFYWRRSLEEIGRKGAILVLTKDNEEILMCIAEYLPFFMMKHDYLSLRIMADDRERITKFLSYVDIPCDVGIVSSDYNNYMFHMENAFGIFGRIYSDASVPMKDGDFYELIGYDNITLKEIIAYVILGLDHVPTIEEIKYGQKWVLANKEYKDVFNSVRPLTGKYEQKRNRELAEKQRMIINDKVHLEEKSIYLYGASDYAMICIEVFEDYNIVGIIDKDKSKVGQERQGIKIYSLDKISDIDFSCDVVFVTNLQYEDVLRKFCSIGGVYNKDFFILYPRPDVIDFDKQELKNYIDKELVLGRNVFLNWRNRFKKEKLLLSPWNASGDIYVASLYLKDYIKEYCPSEYLVLVTSSAAENVSLLLGYNTKRISQEDMNSILLYVRYVGFEKTNSLNTNVNYPNKFQEERIGELFRVLDFNTAHQRMAFLSDVKQTKLELKQNNADEYFKKYNLKKGRTVLLVPYSNSLGSIPEENSVELVNRLKERGYSVCTNVAGDEKPIEGTVGLFLPYDVVLDFVNKAGGVVGIRCGLFDIVSTSEAKMAVYYWKSHQTLFSLIHMGLKTSNILELNTTDDDWDEIVDKTLDFFDADI